MSLPPLMPDVERIVSWVLRDDTDVQNLVDGRVYTNLPRGEKAYPLVLVQRVPGGDVIINDPLYLETATVQVDVYGGSQALAHQTIQTCRQVLARTRGDISQTDSGTPSAIGTVTKVTFGTVQRIPDPDEGRPRYSTDINVTVRPTI